MVYGAVHGKINYSEFKDNDIKDKIRELYTVRLIHNNQLAESINLIYYRFLARMAWSPNCSNIQDIHDEAKDLSKDCIDKANKLLFPYRDSDSVAVDEKALSDKMKKAFGYKDDEEMMRAADMFSKKLEEIKAESERASKQKEQAMQDINTKLEERRARFNK
jgi:hypothetical protein